MIDYIKETIRLAKLGVGTTSPNPLVGAVIVKNNKIIGKGYHKKKGEPHAEVIAIKNAKNTKGATLYVNLEPCCHYGATPPCTKAIINAGIKEVHIATIDPSPWVNGKGIEELKSAGIKVIVGEHEEEAKELNAPYFKWVKTGLPFVMLKAAITLDGKIAHQDGKSKWITNIEARKYVHKLRAQVDAVIVGINTIIKDDPELTVRLVKGKNPKRIILDSKLRIPQNAKVLGDGCIIASTISRKINKAEVWEIKSNNNRVDIVELLKLAAKNNIQSVLIEGGGEVFTEFISKRLVDKFYIFIAPKIFGAGIDFINKQMNDLYIKKVKIKKFIDNILIEGWV